MYYVRELGKKAFFDNQSMNKNPFVKHSCKWNLWIEGYIFAKVHYGDENNSKARFRKDVIL